jgi:anaerobic selenocysteine-containing dehydrogenase
MGFADAMFDDTDEDLVRQALDNLRNPYLQGISYESLLEKKYEKARIKQHFIENLPTPSGRIELYSRRMEANGYPPLPTYTPLKEDSSYPYLFVPGPNHNFLNSTFSNNEKHVNMEKIPRLYINREDAQAIGIADGDRVRVWNDRGECELFASVGESVLPGVVVSQGLWADVPGEGAKHFVNALTPDRIADMGGGATFFSGRVAVEKR